MNKRKCLKCGISYRDRGEDDPSGYLPDLCWNCGFLWKSLELMIQAIGVYAYKKNREIRITLSDIEIWKRPKL